MNCVFIGDSIAQGVALYRPECRNQAVQGRTTAQTLLRIHQIPHKADHVLISVGSNDGRIRLRELRSQVQTLRAELAQYCVTWLLPPSNETARKVIVETAAQYGDQVIDVRPQVNPGQDPVHPSRQGYQQLAAKTRQSVCEIVAEP